MLKDVKKKKKQTLRRTEVKKKYTWINSRLDDTEELFSKLEGRVIEITEPEQKQENK